MQLSGVSGLNFPPFSPSAVSNFFNYFTMPNPIPAASPLQIGTSKDFGVVNTDSTGSGSSIRTDQSFINRAELINFVKSTGIANVNTLQYLGTFSREQNKPTLPLTPASMWPFARVILPQRFYLGNLNLVYPSKQRRATCKLQQAATQTIRKYFGLQFASTGGRTARVHNQVRWKYVGNQDVSNTTPLSAIPAFPSNLTTTPRFFSVHKLCALGRYHC